VLEGELVAVPVAGPVLSRAILSGPCEYVTLPLFWCALRILDDGGLYYVQGQVLLVRFLEAILRSGSKGNCLTNPRVAKPRKYGGILQQR
jgi:hypothetical protein